MLMYAKIEIASLLAHASVILLGTKETMGEDDGVSSGTILLGFLWRFVEVVS